MKYILVLISFFLILVNSCSDKINIVYDSLDSESNGNIKMAYLDGRINGEGEEQCANYFSKGINSDPTIYYCYGCEDKHIVALLLNLDLKQIKYLGNKRKNKYINLEIAPLDGFEMNIATNEILKELNLSVDSNEILKKATLFSQNKNFNMVDVDSRIKGKISGMGDNVYFENSTVFEIINAFNWLVPGDDLFSTLNKSDNRYTFKTKWPNSKSDVIKITTDLGFDSFNSSINMMEYHIYDNE